MTQELPTIVCAWCFTTVESRGEQISHGICVECAMGLLARLPADYLRSIADADGTVSLFSGHKLQVEGPAQAP